LAQQRISSPLAQTFTKAYLEADTTSRCVWLATRLCRHKVRLLWKGGGSSVGRKG
jgi:hypothetical protein